MLSFDTINYKKTFQLGKVVVNFKQIKNPCFNTRGLTSSHFILRGSVNILNSIEQLNLFRTESLIKHYSRFFAKRPLVIAFTISDCL